MEIGNQHFHPAAGKAPPNCFDRERKQLRTTVFSVVAVHAGYYGVAKSEGGASFCDTARFVIVDGKWSALLHSAKSTAPSADVSENHESCRAPIPAFANVWTRRALTNGMQFKTGNQLLQFAIILADRRGSAKPFWALGLRRNCYQH